MRRWSRFARDDSGAAAMEYGLIVALIAVAMIFVLAALDRNLLRHWGGIATAILPGS